MTNPIPTTASPAILMCSLSHTHTHTRARARAHTHTHTHTHSLLNGNQYGFLPQKSTVDTAMAAKGFVRENLQQRNYVVMVSLDVKGAFDVAWWPSILSNLRDLRCPKNL